MSLTCIVCGQVDEGIRETVKDHLVSKQKFEIKVCLNCGFKSTENPPSVEDAGWYYETEEYIEHSNSDKGVVNSLYHVGREFMLGYKLKILNKISTGKKLLDIGTGTGYFINYLSKNGYNVAGIEINEKARKFALDEFGLSVSSPDTLFTEEIGKDFDIITFWHVLEHIYNLDDVIRACIGKLNDNGKIVIALPNNQSFDAKYYGEYWAAYDVPRHLWHFSPKSLENFMNNHNLKLIDSKVLPLDPFYISIISAQYKNSWSSYLSVPFVSIISYITSIFFKSKASSLIYILEKQ